MKRKIQAGRGHDHHAPASGHHSNPEHAQYQRLNDQDFLRMRAAAKPSSEKRSTVPPRQFWAHL